MKSTAAKRLNMLCLDRPLVKKGNNTNILWIPNSFLGLRDLLLTALIVDISNFLMKKNVRLYLSFLATYILIISLLLFAHLFYLFLAPRIPTRYRKLCLNM